MGNTLGNLLEEIKYGKDFVDSKNTINNITTFIDEDYNIFLAGKRASSLLEECDSTKQYTKKLGRAVRNYSEFEKKILEGKDISSVYAKMRIDSIVEDVNTATIELSNNPKVLRESNKEAVSKVIASLDYGLSLLGESSPNGVKSFKKAKATLQAFINKEISLIKDSL